MLLLTFVWIVNSPCVTGTQIGKRNAALTNAISSRSVQKCSRRAQLHLRLKIDLMPLGREIAKRLHLAPHFLLLPLVIPQASPAFMCASPRSSDFWRDATINQPCQTCGDDFVIRISKKNCRRHRPVARHCHDRTSLLLQQLYPDLEQCR